MSGCALKVLFDLNNYPKFQVKQFVFVGRKKVWERQKFWICREVDLKKQNQVSKKKLNPISWKNKESITWSIFLSTSDQIVFSPKSTSKYSSNTLLSLLALSYNCIIQFLHPGVSLSQALYHSVFGVDIFSHSSYFYGILMQKLWKKSYSLTFIFHIQLSVVQPVTVMKICWQR